MNILIESIHRTKLYDFKIRTWRQQEENYEFVDIDPDVEEMLGDISPDRSAAYIAKLLLTIPNMNAVEVIGAFDNGLVIYKDWP